MGGGNPCKWLNGLMTPDELKSIPKEQFVVMKTGAHPMQTRLRMFLDWGITFEEQYQTPNYGRRKVYYADRRRRSSKNIPRPCGDRFHACIPGCGKIQAKTVRP